MHMFAVMFEPIEETPFFKVIFRKVPLMGMKDFYYFFIVVLPTIILRYNFIRHRTCIDLSPTYTHTP